MNKLIIFFYSQKKDFSRSELRAKIETKYNSSEDQASDKSTESADEILDIQQAKDVVKKSKPGFLKLREAVKIIQERAIPTVSEIPTGNKSDCMVLLSLCDIDKLGDGRMIFFDDCGSYAKSSSHNYTLLRTNLNHIYSRNEKWFHDKKFTKMLDSVTNGDILHVKTLTNLLDSEGRFKRQITRCSASDVALVEYSGKKINLYLIFFKNQRISLGVF